jgi:hypothetical protein
MPLLVRPLYLHSLQRPCSEHQDLVSLVACYCRMPTQPLLQEQCFPRRIGPARCLVDWL